MSETTAETLDRLAAGYRGAQVLFTAVRLDLFTRLAAGERSAEEVAADLGADPRGVRILLDASTALGLLDKRDGRYRNGEIARRHLAPDAPEPKAAIVRHGARLYERWGRLYDAVLRGEPAPEAALDPRLDGGEEGFAHAMADVARASARTTVEALDLDGVATALDVGGGPGLYAIEMARARPDLVATVLDRPATLEVAGENARRAGLADRVRLRPGDALAGGFGGPYDLVFTSNVVHIYSPEDNRRLLRNAVAALAPGGRLAIKDFLLDPDRTSPPGGALFAVNMLVSTAGGASYSAEEVTGWLAGLGLAVESITDLTAQSRLLVARASGRG